jgi:nitrate reductase gamma subunit
MLFNLTLAIALALFAIGLIHKIDSWFMRSVGTGDGRVPIGRRFAAGLKGALGTVLSARIFALLKVLVVDVLFQARILKDKHDPFAWFMHALIFWGFILLLLFHALGGIFSTALDPDYQSTLNPFMFLRNLFGLLVLLGLALAVIRRIAHRAEIKTTGMDVYAIAILAVITLSGFLLEGLKITSRTEFAAMVEDYGRGIDVAEVAALEAYWVVHYGLVSPTSKSIPSAELLAQGREVHAESCLSCHSPPQSAFVSYPLSRLMAPVAGGLDRAGFGRILWMVHFLACFFGLAFLAFSKLFHIISTPVSLIVAEVAGKTQDAATVATRQVIELDGCSHGGACHVECPVRQRRVERIQGSEVYEPMLAYLGAKTAEELGSRKVAD